MMARAHVIAASLALAAACVAGSCYSPSLDNCVQTCGSDGSCPDGQHCDHGLCTSLSSACENGDAPSGGSAGAGSGAQSGTGAGSGTGAQSSTGGASSGSGAQGGGVGTGAAPTGGMGGLPSSGGVGGEAGGSTCGDECPPPSCHGLPLCGDVSCCDSIAVAGGQFPLGRSTDGTDAHPSGDESELPENTAFVSAFRLDRFEVTVGRFRKFVESYDGTPPAAGSGAHPHIEGSGWQSAWDTELAANAEELKTDLQCKTSQQTYTISVGANEQKPVVCVDWYTAFAFCIWDGGRLPTEAEWEYAAAGGAENRLYPWGDAALDASRARYALSAASEVGSLPDGSGRFGHLDLSGNVEEWIFDPASDDYEERANPTSLCNERDCADVDATPYMRGLRGGDYLVSQAMAEPLLRAASRSGTFPTTWRSSAGLRCARSGL